MHTQTYTGRQPLFQPLTTGKCRACKGKRKNDEGKDCPLCRGTGERLLTKTEFEQVVLREGADPEI